MKHDIKKKALLLFLSILLLTVPLLLVAPAQADACTWVDGYKRKDGTRVKGYWRGCSSSSSNSSSSSSSGKTSAPITTQGQYYGVSSIVNLYRGSNFAGTADSSKLVYVNGYYRKDGTYVRPHYRTHANNYITDNFSSQNLSTLPSLSPSNKYPGYQYGSSTKVIEKYLMYNVDDRTLTSAQLSSLQNYANSLNAYDHDPSLKDSAADTGYRFYFDLYKDDTIASQKVKFDLNANKTLEEYLLDVFLSNQNVLYLSYDREIELIIPIYAYYLREAQKDPAKIEQAKAVGTKFYKMMRNTATAIDNQIEMDLLQHFDRVDEHAISSHSVLELRSYGKYDDIEAYIRTVGTMYHLTIDRYDFTIVGYAVSLEMLYDSYGLPLDIKLAYNDGIEFYTNKGMTSEQAELQTRNDILLFYKYLES